MQSLYTAIKKDSRQILPTAAVYEAPKPFAVFQAPTVQQTPAVIHVQQQEIPSHNPDYSTKF